MMHAPACGRVLVFALTTARFARAAPALAQFSSQTNGKDSTGIGVGRAKVFDNGALTPQREDLEARLDRGSHFSPDPFRRGRPDHGSSDARRIHV